MRYGILLLFFFCMFCTWGQEKILLVGNYEGVCFQTDSFEVVTLKKLPEDISLYRIVCIFSGAESILYRDDIYRIEQYLEKGGGIYCGADNWPLQAESNQLTMALYAKESWGNFDQEKARVDTRANNKIFSGSDSFPVGKTTVAFPMDYRLKVEVWVEDQPLLLSGKYGNGRIIIDGGYSRFYCESADEERKRILDMILVYLMSR